jgi:hypothetical protein
MTSLVSCGHCVVCPSSIYGFWWPFRYLVAIVLSVLRFTASSDLLGILLSLCCPQYTKKVIRSRKSKKDRQHNGHKIPKRSSEAVNRFWWPFWYLVAIVLSVLLRFTASDYLLGILWPLCCDRQHNGHKIPKRSSEAVNRRRTDNTMTTRYHKCQEP